MVTQVSGPNALEAWREDVRLLAREREVYNLITIIDRPTEMQEEWFSRFDPQTVKGSVQRLSEVVTTIFPFRLAARGYTDAALYARYLDVHNRAKRIHNRTKRSWGTYFERMICFGEGRVNQLDIAIASIRSWTTNHKAALAIHISSAETDSIKKVLGNPCLQYVELLCPDANTLSLLAIYRNHDFFEKALGNFIGLGQLQRFVCEQTDRRPGQLVCHSAHAYFQSSRTQLETLAQL